MKRHTNKAKAVKKVKHIDWAFRRLRHQAVVYFSGKDPEVRQALNESLAEAKRFTEVESKLQRDLKIPQREIKRFLDHFFGHKIQKTVVE